MVFDKLKAEGYLDNTIDDEDIDDEDADDDIDEDADTNPYYTYIRPDYAARLHPVPSYMKEYICMGTANEHEARKMVEDIRKRKSLSHEQLLDEVRNVLLWSYVNCPEVEDDNDDMEHVDMPALFLLMEEFNMTELQQDILEIFRQPIDYTLVYDFAIMACYPTILFSLFADDYTALKEFVNTKGYCSDSYEIVMAAIANIANIRNRRKEVIKWLKDVMQRQFALKDDDDYNDDVMDNAIRLAIKLKAFELLPLIRSIVNSDCFLLELGYTADYDSIKSDMQDMEECDSLNCDTMDEYFSRLDDDDFDMYAVFKSDYYDEEDYADDDEDYDDEDEDDDADDFDEYDEVDDDDDIDSLTLPEMLAKFSDAEINNDPLLSFIKANFGKKEPHIPSAASRCKTIPLFSDMQDPIDCLSLEDADAIHSGITEIFEDSRSKISKLKLMTYPKMNEYSDNYMSYLTADSIDDQDRIEFYLEECNKSLRALVSKYKKVQSENPDIRNEKVVKEILAVLKNNGLDID